MKAAARARGEDVVDLGMGNPDGAPPTHVIDKLAEVAAKPDAHRYSASRGIPGLQESAGAYYQRRFGVDRRSRQGSHRHPGLQGRPRQPRPGDHRAGRRRARAQPQLPDPHLRLHHRRRRDPLDPGRARRGFLRAARTGDALHRAAAQGAGRSAIRPTRPPMSPTALLRASGRLRARAWADRHLRPRLCRNLFRRHADARRSSRSKARRMSRSSSPPCPRPTRWPAGGSASRSATPRLIELWRG